VRLNEAVDPWHVFAVWYDEGVAHEPDVPNAMQLATVGPDGRPSLRTVLLKGYDPEGLVFYTNLNSRKSRELSANPNVAITFHHKSLERQIHVEGTAQPVSDAEADAYFATRPRGSQLGAWASQQGQAMRSRETLEHALAAMAAQFERQDVARPPHWGGWRVVPSTFEFWQGRADRLHDRVTFVRDGQGWRRLLLQP
jgi:pyridoxamine 5'-phosphate oxidase